MQGRNGAEQARACVGLRDTGPTRSETRTQQQCVTVRRVCLFGHTRTPMRKTDLTRKKQRQRDKHAQRDRVGQERATATAKVSTAADTNMGLHQARRRSNTGETASATRRHCRETDHRQNGAMNRNGNNDVADRTASPPTQGNNTATRKAAKRAERGQEQRTLRANTGEQTAHSGKAKHARDLRRTATRTATNKKTRKATAE
ncbi:hypothetical protein ERJ75_000550500 [Trypanosoma vivax]|nr:hypothetical protein ERJ75_000550500 [Trypanosoma vivax]